MSQTTEKINHKFRMISQQSDQKHLVDTVCISSKRAEAAKAVKKNKKEKIIWFIEGDEEREGRHLSYCSRTWLLRGIMIS